MKQLLASIFIFLGLGLSAQSEVQFLNAFGTEPISSVANLLADNITLCINDNVSEVSKAEAIKRLSAFLDGKDMSRKKILHNGKSPEKDSSYKVARIKTEDGTYRIFAYAEIVNGMSMIKEIRIDKM